MNFDLELKKKKKSPQAPEKGRSSLGKLLIGAFFVFIIAYISYLPPALSIKDTGLQAGDIAGADIVIRKDMTVEDKEMTELNRRKALDLLIPVYEFNEQKITGSQLLLNEWFKFFMDIRKELPLKTQNLEAVRTRISENFGLDLPTATINTLIRSNPFARIDLNRLLQEIENWAEKGILLSKIGIPQSDNGIISLYSEKTGHSQVKVSDLYDLNDISSQLSVFLRNSSLKEKEKEILKPILLEFISINVSFSKVLTRLQEEKTLALVNPVFIQLKKGKIVLRRGDEIGKDHLRLIHLISVEEKTASRKIPDIFLILVILSILFFFFWRLNILTRIGGINRNRLNFASGITFIASAVIYRLALFIYPLILKNITLNTHMDSAGLIYGIPFAVGSLIIAFLFDLQSAVIFSIINAVISAFICDGNFKIVLFVLVGNLAVGFGVEYYQRLKRSSILKAGFFWLLPVNMLITLMLALTEDNATWTKVVFYVLLGILSALLSALIANFMIPLWEVIFKLVTDLKLVEITNLNLPIFREMLEKAPGTYHHAQMVASLAEAAAQELELSPLLVRAMALYHDIGKIDNPQFYTENQSVYEDPHGQLTALESAKTIIAHIPQGMEKAEQLKLPKKVSQAIFQHHGTKLVKFFYEKARENGAKDLDDFDENMFRYPGKKPQGTEEAIIMLADQVEAAAKSLSAPNDHDIKNVVEKIIASDIADNQFDECDGLTFKSLNIIAGSFYNKLTSIYQQRIAYPGFDFSKEKTNDQNPA
ncbi:MAG: HDIG domain-containing protein [Acidobacteria bacterium]|nr:HDIG domain-containing protein [Acidobacteriota bacterium]MBU4307517.1 HDIG domain-containing protein [Acidobacteriota bacterium]MBU4404554.1 HDIG domain-containing protein [Acidobacteriota bacterium]MCG2810900.1 HDIG domain-containing protein [Candidatus Aminicenantes bacterium]